MYYIKNLRPSKSNRCQCGSVGIIGVDGNFERVPITCTDFDLTSEKRNGAT